MPQGAVTGLPGQMGQGSPAAASQTVKRNSRSAAPGAANSSQLLDRSPSVGKPRSRRISIAMGWTSPLGKLPAENARKRPSPSRLSSASARIERAELPVHRNRTLWIVASATAGRLGCRYRGGAAIAFGGVVGQRGEGGAVTVDCRLSVGEECFPGHAVRIGDPAFLGLGVAASGAA